MKPVAVITGASEGLGLALARELAGLGWSLVLDARHPDLLEAVAGRALVDRAYADTTDDSAPHYLWHEFGDSMLLLP